MTTSSRLILTLSVLVAVLGLSWVWLRRSEYTRTELAAGDWGDLRDFESTDVLRIRISRGEEEIDLRRADGGWRMTSFHDYPARTETIDRFVGGWRGLWQPEVRGEQASSHAVFGVGAKGALIALTLRNGRSLTLVVGKPDGPTGERCFVRRPEDVVVHSVRPDLYGLAGLFQDPLDPNRWADRELWALPAGEVVQSLIFSTAATPVRLERSSDGWRVQEPESFAVDGAEVESILEGLGRLPAERLVAPTPLADHGLDPPERTLTVVMASGRTAELQFGAAVGARGFYARVKSGEPSADDGRVGLVRTDLRNRLFRTLEELR